MSPAAFFKIWAGRLAWAMLAAAVALASLLAIQTRSTLANAPPPTATPAAAPAIWQAPEPLHALDWSLLRGRVGGAASDQNALSHRFRLAGTFFEFTAMGSSSRLAILDDAQQGAQILVSERDVIGDVTVIQIQRDRVLLRNGAGLEAELTLSFTGSGGAGTNTATGAGESAAAGTFGVKRLGESRWLFNRDALLRYYQGLRDQPERLVLLFDSLKPVYASGNRITGYQLGIEGEKDFFEAAGLQQGDIVTRVNNIEMTNRRRAEFFIGQFVRDDANAFMLDVVRGGATNRLVYEVR